MFYIKLLKDRFALFWRNYFRSRIIYHISTIILFIWTVFNISRRVELYVSNPVSYSLEQEIGSAFTFPSVTICPTVLEQMLNKSNTSIENLFNTEINVTDLWKLTGGDLLTFLTECTYGVGQSCKSKWKTEFTAMGMCFTLEFQEKLIYNGILNQLSFSIDYSNFMGLLFIHEIGLPIDQVVKAERSYDLKPGLLYNIYYYYRQFVYLNRINQPCSDKKIFWDCWHYNLYALFMTNKTCRIPNVPMTVSDLPLCTLFDDAMEYLDTLNFNRDLYASKILNICGSSCIKINYWYSVDQMNLTNFVGSNSLMQFNVFPVQDNSEVIREQWGYSFVALISDIGALSCALLGFSVLKFTEVIEKALFIARAVVKKHLN